MPLTKDLNNKSQPSSISNRPDLIKATEEFKKRKAAKKERSERLLKSSRDTNIPQEQEAKTEPIKDPQASAPEDIRAPSPVIADGKGLITEEDTSTKTEEDIPTKTEEDILTKTEEDIPTKTEEDIPTKTEEDIPTKTEEDIPTKTEEDIRKEVEAEAEQKSVQQVFAEQNSIAFRKNKDGSVTFEPGSLDEAIDLFAQFGKGTKISKTSKNAIVGSKIYEKYSKYKQGSTDTYLQGLKSNDISTDGEMWDRLVKMNGGEPTVEMLEAQKQYEQGLNINNVNNTAKVISGEDIASQAKENQKQLQGLDKAYTENITALYGELASNYEKSKQGNDKLNGLNESLANTSDRIDQLQLEKRKVMKNVQKKHPGLTLGSQLAIANDQLDSINDELFGLQREYNRDFSSYKFEENKSQEDFNFQAGLIQSKINLSTDLYKTTRSDTIRQTGIERQDTIRQDEIERQDILLSEQISRQEAQLDAAIKRKDKEGAEQFAQELALTKLKFDLNAENQDKFSTANVAGGGALILNKQTGEYEVVGQELAKTVEAGVTPGVGGTSDAPVVTSIRDFIIGKEGFRAEAYDDATGKTLQPGQKAIGKATIGYGFTRLNGKPIEAGQTISRQDADNQVQSIIDQHSNYKNLVKVPLNENQEAALASFEYNLGPAIWDESAKGVIDKINAGDLEGAGALMKQFNKSGTVFMQGLQNRRNEEAALLTSTQVPGPISLSQDALIFNVGKSIFGSKISDAEGARVESFVNKGFAQGLNTDEIVDEILFFKPTNNKELGGVLKDTLIANNVDLSGFDMRRLGNFLSEDKISNAITKVEKGVLDTAKSDDPDGFISERLTSTMVRRADEINTLIDQLQNTEEGKKNPIGVGGGSIEKYLGRFKSEEATEIANKATRLVGDFRKQNLGSAVTESESEFLESVIPNIFDSTENFQIKVGEFKDQALGEINDFRNILELPPLTSESLIDKTLRSQGYLDRGRNASPIQKVQQTQQQNLKNDYMNSVTPKTSSSSASSSYLDSLNLTQ